MCVFKGVSCSFGIIQRIQKPREVELRVIEVRARMTRIGNFSGVCRHWQLYGRQGSGSIESNRFANRVEMLVCGSERGDMDDEIPIASWFLQPSAIISGFAISWTVNACLSR
jgi:hypothetical protein